MWDTNGYKAITYADTDNGGTDYPLHTGWGWPAWIDDERLLHSEKPNVLSKDLSVRVATQPNNQGTVWYKLDIRSPLLDVDIRGNAFAGLAGEDGRLMTVFRFTGEPGTGGLTVKLVNAGTKTTVTAAYKGKTVASGSGTTTVKLKFTKKAVRQLRPKRSVKLTLTAGATSATVTPKR